MKIVHFDDIRKEIVNHIKDVKLIPFIGSGFTRVCNTKRGHVPSGADYKEYMIQKICSLENLSAKELASLRTEKFSSVSSIYHQKVPSDIRREYLLRNFSKVELPDYKCQLLEIPWPYIYTLNIDDGIEHKQQSSPNQ